LQFFGIVIRSAGHYHEAAIGFGLNGFKFPDAALDAHGFP
jgi:hypothetical protein